MAHSYLTEKNVFRLWEASKRYTDRLTEPFEEYERISRNQPAEDSDPAYPNVTDGTTASIIQKTPKRVVQQVPTGIVECDYDDAWLPIVAEYIFLNKILPFANEDFDLFEKSQLIIENGLAFGYGLSYCPFMNHGGHFSPDMTMPYWGDIYIQPGKKSGRSCQYVFIRSWWQKEDIKALIESEKKLKQQAKDRGEEYESTWDLDALEKIKDKAESKDQQATTPHEDSRGEDNSGIELVTGFQVGVGATFYTFSPNSKIIVRRKKNKDPRGKMPLDWFYGDVDGSNPLGRSIIELIGGLQNLIDADMQAYQYNRALALQPPVVKYGNIGNFRFAPNVVIDAKNDPAAKIVPLTIDTSALTNYPQLYGLQKSQLLNLVASPDTSISSDVGNPGFSKTPAGINSQKANISIDDNAVRKRFEAWFESWAETAINLYFAERSGVEVLKLDDKTALRLRQLIKDGDMEEGLLNDKNELIINYDEATPALHFTVNASTSKMADDQTKLDGLTLVQKFMDSSPTLQQVVPVKNQLEIYNSFVALSGVEDPEKLQVDIEEFEKQQAEAEAMAQEQAAAEQQAMEAQAMQPAGQMSEQDMQIVASLQQLGFSDEVIAQAMEMLEQGATEQDVIAALGAVNV